MNSEDQITIKFLVDVDKHCNVRVVGNTDALGQWKPASGLQTCWLIDTIFESEITINKNAQNTIEYKYVSCPGNPTDLKWEDGANRILDISNSNFLQVQDHFKIEDTHHQALRKDTKLVNFDKTFGRAIEQKRTITDFLSNHVLVRFQVATGTGHPRDDIVICSNNKRLERVVMQYTYPMWELDVLVPLEDFPIQYKYATVLWKPEILTQSVVEETRQPRTVQLPTKSNNYERLVIQLHDEYHSQSSINCFTTPVTHAHLQNWIKLRSHAYLDPIDNKAVVSNTYDTHSAQRFSKPFKIRASSSETYTVSNIHEDTWQLLFDALTDDLCSLRSINFHDSTQPVTIQEIEKFSDMLLLNTSFTKLAIFSRALTVDKLCETIASHRRLKTLEVLSAIGPDLCASLGQILALSKTISHLHVALEDVHAFFCLNKYLNKGARLSALTLNFTQLNINAEEAALFREALKNSRTITSLSVFSLFSNIPLSNLLPFDDDFFAVNWSLTHAEISAADLQAHRNYLERNKTHQQDMLAKTTIILYNAVRSREVLESLLPIELWLLIFSFVQYPGQQYKFDDILVKLLDDTTVRRVID